MRVPPQHSHPSRPASSILLDSSRCRPFRTPPKTEVETPKPPIILTPPPPPKKQNNSGGFFSFNFFSSSSSDPLSGWDYLGIAAISAVSALALAAITGFIAAPCCREETIGQTELSYWDKRQIQSNPLYQENLFNEHSSIYQAISLYSDQLNIQKTSSYLNWIPFLLGITNPDVLVISRKDQPEISLTCQAYSSEVYCYLNGNLSHKDGSLSYSYREFLNPYVNHNQETLTLKPGLNPFSKKSITARYPLGHNQQIADLFTKLISGQYECCKDKEDVYHFPTKFQQHPEIKVPAHLA